MATDKPLDQTEYDDTLEKKYRPLVIILSIIIPVVVALLFGVKVEGVDLSFLPPIYAIINGLTAVLLVLAVIQIKKGNKKRHEQLIALAVICSLFFLVAYIAYHITSNSTPFGGSGVSAYIYYFILISHILLSIAVIPMVMMTYLKGWAGNVVSHRKWAKVTFPIWLYVAVTGVVVYLMISPYYV
ncbi:MAG: putative membrane protein [Crocinitomix sp.]|jgi:putative membrane protein